ncbi:transcriptional regulator, TetR family [Methylobacterium sp. 4-46]|uniref:TetR/AcrR family transcriptional regulator n=1 Tax=unclassified Methylobacterium TaxID=2615210 RepID=UPI000152BF12|nr:MULTISPECIES: TetR/AcrR family transcriptional regulator [Methylobacterium]ACA20661.1 transcriptional regulator, TetR family [Methylobacterium sp. 4-46]WFT79820.1 TetR/AcrR family transcriptional regulator [Methylobacterium nodulans]
MAEAARGAEAGRRGPSPEKTARTRAAIVGAALGVFLERGFSGTRMIDVAARAGVAKGTLYLYFRDKEALFEGVLREVMADLVASLSGQGPGPGESLRDFLRRVAVPAFRDLEATRRAAVVRLVIAEGGRFPAVAAAYRRVVIGPVTGAVRRFAAEALARGELTSDALVRFPLLLAAPGVLATVWNGLYGAEEPLDAGAVVEAFLDWAMPARAGESGAG